MNLFRNTCSLHENTFCFTHKFWVIKYPNTKAIARMLSSPLKLCTYHELYRSLINTLDYTTKGKTGTKAHEYVK